jgi:hypothetical protein
MTEPSITLRSSIKPELMRSTLFKGTAIASFGALLLILGGSLLSVNQLQIWGIPLLAASLYLIRCGLLPYRQLSQLELKPYQIVITPDERLLFKTKDEMLFSMGFQTIQSLKYIDGDRTYGIGITLKQPLPEKIRVATQQFDMRQFQERSRKEHDCDLFLPYFTKRSYAELEECLEA